jgi:uncharacterized protein (DUF2252 family)
MLESPFAFLRGAAVVMANDLAGTPTTGVRVQACGDAHLANFGVFATPERNLVFDVNDFDETLPAPWEWDVKRLVASIAIAGANLEIHGAENRQITQGAAAAYHSGLAELAQMGPLDVWYSRLDVEQVLAIARENNAGDLRRALRVAKVRHRTSLTALPKVTTVVDGARRIIDDPPLIVHEADSADDWAKMFDGYTDSVPPDRRPLLDRYDVVDTARKVVGVGSVGTRCYLSLLMDADGRSPVFLQLKEAKESVLAPHAGASEFGNQGQRVVVGQRLMQAASDIFLGWTRWAGHDFYVRQFRDMKGSVDLDAMTSAGFASYAAICGRTLARAHARSGDAAVISGYLGTGDRFDQAAADFAASYATQNERDYAALVAAVESGRVVATTGK